MGSFPDHAAETARRLRAPARTAAGFAGGASGRALWASRGGIASRIDRLGGSGGYADANRSAGRGHNETLGVLTWQALPTGTRWRGGVWFSARAPKNTTSTAPATPIVSALRIWSGSCLARNRSRARPSRGKAGKTVLP